MVMTDIQDYWRQSWGGDKAILQDNVELSTTSYNDFSKWNTIYQYPIFGENLDVGGTLPPVANWGRDSSISSNVFAVRPGDKIEYNGRTWGQCRAVFFADKNDVVLFVTPETKLSTTSQYTLIAPAGAVKCGVSALKSSWTDSCYVRHTKISSRLYGGEGEAAVVWSGTDVIYAKQRENLSKNDFYEVQGGVSVNKNNGIVRFELLSAGQNTYTRAHIDEKIVSGSTYTFSFDVTEVHLGGSNPIRLFIYPLDNSIVSVDKVGHFSKTFTAQSDRADNTPIQMFNTSGSTAAAVGDYCIIKNIKLEKNIVDTQYSVAPSVTDNRVKIGKHWYHTTQIGNLIWTAENLNEDLGGGTWEGYYNNDPSYGVKGYGKLYTWDAICKANETPSDALAAILPAGWRVPTKADFDALATSVGVTNAAKVKEKWYWTEGVGTNDTGFSAIAAGYRGNDSFMEVGSYANFWTSSEYSPSIAYYRYFDTSAQMYEFYYYEDKLAASLRLVKDAAASNDVTFLNGQST